MPQLATQNTTKLFLPSTEALPEDQKAWVEIRKDILVADIEGFSMGGEQNLTTLVSILSNMIISWNFTNADNNPEPITVDTVRHLNINDFNFIVSNLFQETLSLEDKKKLLNSSVESPTATPTA